MARTKTMCACGHPLHYTDPELQRLVEQQIAELGECVKIRLISSGREFMVPRHFISLHGVTAIDLPVVAKEYGFEEVTVAQEKPFMSLWTVYYSPRDFPGKYVVRRHDILRGEGSRASEEYYVADSLEEVRGKIPWGMVCLMRSDDDEPQILETWV